MGGLQGMRVLVVENDEMSAMLLQMQLEHAGAMVCGVAASVAQALAAIEQNVAQVVLLDYRLAGSETSEPVAQRLLERGIPFVMATGMSAAHLPPALSRGFLLPKPYLAAELEAVLKRAVASTLPATG